jgi:hypothetical protein
MKDKFNEFFTKYNGLPVEVNDPSNPYQCMDLAYAWCDFIQIPRDAIRHLYAYEVYTKPNDLTVKYFEVVPNTPSGIPQIGDLVVFSTKVGTAGHISIATGEGTLNSFVSFDQNFGATVKKAGLITHPYDAVLGWLRPRVTTTPVFTDQTKIPLKEFGEVELLAIVSTIRDQKRTIQESQLRIEQLIKEIEAYKNNPITVDSRIQRAKDILYGSNFFWIKLRLLKELLA